ncbi:MAG: hypothetical protein LBO05_03475 [Deltaproteobacteria bacterium]|jgi:hypothetical protein|nr:hypothetical protein [Deltaproteobacteria bacterium]
MSETEHYDREEVLEILRDFIEDIGDFLKVVKAVAYDVDLSNGLDQDDEVPLAIFVKTYGRKGEFGAEDELLLRTEAYDICISPALHLAKTLTTSKLVARLIAGGVEVEL